MVQTVEAPVAIRPPVLARPNYVNRVPEYMGILPTDNGQYAYFDHNPEAGMADTHRFSRVKIADASGQMDEKTRMVGAPAHQLKQIQLENEFEPDMPNVLAVKDADGKQLVEYNGTTIPLETNQLLYVRKSGKELTFSEDLSEGDEWDVALTVVNSEYGGPLIVVERASSKKSVSLQF